MSAQELENLYQLINESDLDGVAFNPGCTLFYLTGLEFHLMERPILLLIKPGFSPALIVPELESLKAESCAIDLDIDTYPDDPSQWQASFNRVCDRLQMTGEVIGVEAGQMRMLEMSYLQNAAPSVKLIPADGLITQLRAKKKPEELERIRKAIQIAEKAFLDMLGCIHPGMNERQIASELTIQLYRAGSDIRLPFDPIVASGPNGANPHAVPGERTICSGDLVVVDWGARFEGYISDLTRMVAFGKINQELAKAHELVVKANQAGREHCRPGYTAADVDRATRKVIVEAGYGEFFTHRTGHGIGLEAHEAPYIHSGNTDRLTRGMTFTIEPGIYLPGLGGVRIEDNVAITAEGREDLSNLPRELYVIS